MVKAPLYFMDIVFQPEGQEHIPLFHYKASVYIQKKYNT